MSITDAARRKRRAELKVRLESDTEDHLARCTIPSCHRPTMRAARVGLSAELCKYHSQRVARHGSAFAPTIRAADLKPYLATARRWIGENTADAFTIHALRCLRGLLDGAGMAEPAMDLKGRSAAFRSRVAFARLREAGVEPERLLATHLAIAALIEDDNESHRVREYRIVQVAKVAHRLASGTHRRWDFPLSDGTTAPLVMHVYPKSAGRVLRVMGEELETACELVTSRDMETIRRLKRERHGPHTSQLPGWRPRWQRERTAAMA
ncbi:hypothetical protein ACFZ8E_22705 [Methylobacterium sp. HMF5984]|uniref:hypothetical protein n=1 Tax=Methylobacterium sp. HMF5984 TaxID=3367370 RepID=UPI0038520C32